MAWPAGGVPTVNLDAGTDSAATARADLFNAVQQLNLVIGSRDTANGVLGTDATGVAPGYARLSAAQTFTAKQSFTANAFMSALNGAYIEARDTALAVNANGLSRLYINSAGSVFFLKNTAAAGDFSTYVNLFVLNPSGAGTFLSTVSGADATAATHFVTKQQLDAKVYGGSISSVGTGLSLPAGWTVAKIATGIYQVTHNLNAIVQYTANGGAGVAVLGANGLNSFQVFTYSFAGVAADMSVQFVLVKV